MTTQAGDADRRRRRRIANPDGAIMSIADYNDAGGGTDVADALTAAIDIAAGRRPRPAPKPTATLTPAQRVDLWRRAVARRRNGVAK